MNVLLVEIDKIKMIYLLLLYIKKVYMLYENRNDKQIRYGGVGCTWSRNRGIQSNLMTNKSYTLDSDYESFELINKFLVKQKLVSH